jgi:hypothetical protein
MVHHGNKLAVMDLFHGLGIGQNLLCLDRLTTDEFVFGVFIRSGGKAEQSADEAAVLVFGTETGSLFRVLKNNAEFYLVFGDPGQPFIALIKKIQMVGEGKEFKYSSLDVGLAAAFAATDFAGKS